MMMMMMVNDDGDVDDRMAKRKFGIKQVCPPTGDFGPWWSWWVAPAAAGGGGGAYS